jgi:hypothetical protein
MTSLATLVLIAVNLTALIAFAFGLVRPSAEQVRQMLRVAMACTAAALVLWLLLPALHAADLRAAMSRWSAGERQLVQQNMPGMNLNPIYDVSVLFDSLYVFPLPIFCALILRFRWVRLSRVAPLTVP